METVYIDRLFFLNLICDYLILLVSARICGVLLKRVRYFLAAVLGALYAALSILPSLAFLPLTPVKLAVGTLMALIAFSAEERLARCVLVFFSVSALFGGAVWAVSLKSGVGALNAVYLPLTMPVLIFSFALVYALLSLVFRRALKETGRKIYIADIEYNSARITLRALYDSGNSLFDPITGSSVLICGAEAVSPLFPDCCEIFKTGDSAGIVSAPALAGRLRLIPYTAVGTKSGLLPAFRPDSITLDGKKRDDIIVAVAPNAVSGDGFDCII